MFRRLIPALLSCALCTACGPSGPEGAGGGAEPARDVVRQGQPQVVIVLSDKATPGIFEAAAELSNALTQITGVTFPEPTLDTTSSARITIRVGLGKEGSATDQTAGLTRDAYRITTEAQAARWVITVRAGGPVGLQYALYDLCQSMGVRYLHPEQTYYPKNPGYQMALPINRYRRPDLQLRGFQHDTRVPIPYTEFLLRGVEEIPFGTDEDDVIDARGHLDRYLLWLARNRMNAHQFHVLDSVALTQWPAFITAHIDRAHELGIEVGAVVSLSDDTERSLRLVVDPSADAIAQIEATLDQLLVAPFDHLVLRTESSAVARPPEDALLAWIDAVKAHLDVAHPGVELQVSVPARQDVLAADGSSWFHLVAATSPDIALHVETTMPYTVGEVYPHQRDLHLAQSGSRVLIHAPTTAYGRGVDVDVPLALPLLGLVRRIDLAEDLSGVNLLGQIVRTAGDAYGFWLWDLISARSAWDRKATFAEVLAWLGPLLGPYEDLLSQWATIQKKYLVDTNPALLGYIGGERSAHDLGLLHRGPDRPVRKTLAEVIAMDEAVFTAWKASDYEPLDAMRTAYRALLSGVPEPTVPEDEKDDTVKDRVRRELDNLLRLHLARLDLVVASLALAMDLRGGANEKEREPEHAVINGAMATAKLRLDQGKAHFRFHSSLLLGKRQTLTTAPAGYLEDTQKALFWKRREAEVEAVEAAVAMPDAQAWKEDVIGVFVVADGQASVTLPAGPGADTVLGGLVPALLIGVHAWPQGVQGEVDVSIALDRDGNGLPDAGLQVRIDDGSNVPGASASLGTKKLSIPFVDSTGETVGTLALEEVTLELVPKHVAGQIQEIQSGTLTASARVPELLLLMELLSGGALDAGGTTELLGTLAGFGADSPPETIPLEVQLGAFDTPTDL